MLKWVLTAAVLLSLTACGRAAPDQTQTSQTQSSHTSSARHQYQPQLTVQAAWALFAQHYPQAALTQLTLEQDDGQWQYELTGQDGHAEYELTLAASDGQVLAQEQDDRAGAATLSQKGLAPLAAITRAAAKTLTGSVATEWQLKRAQGQMVWEVTVEAGHRQQVVTLAATTGQILHQAADD